MTPEETKVAKALRRLEEDKHDEILARLTRIEAFMEIAAGTVITDPKLLELAVDEVMDNVKD